MDNQAKEVSELIASLVERYGERMITRLFKRGVVSEKNSDGTFDVTIEGANNPTQNIPVLNGASPAVGDKVLIVSIGTTGANLLLLGRIGAKPFDWKNVTYQNGWLRYAPEWQDAGYYRDGSGIVHLRGMIKSGTIGSAAFTLPVGYRPANQLLMSTQSSPGDARVDIRTSGAVVPSTGNNTWFSLDGLSFPADA